MEQKFHSMIEEINKAYKDMAERLEQEQQKKEKYRIIANDYKYKSKEKQEKIEEYKKREKAYEQEIKGLESKLYEAVKTSGNNKNIKQESGKYVAYVDFAGRKMRIGEYKTAEQARAAKEQAERNLYSELA